MRNDRSSEGTVHVNLDESAAHARTHTCIAKKGNLKALEVWGVYVAPQLQCTTELIIT